MPPNRIAFVSFLTVEIAVGLTVGAWELTHWQCDNWIRFFAYFAVSMASARLKIRIPNVVATLSPTFILIVLATMQLSFPEAVVISAGCAVLQTVSKKGVARLDQLAFNSSLSVLAPFVFHHGYELLKDTIPVIGIQLGLIARSDSLLPGQYPHRGARVDPRLRCSLLALLALGVFVVLSVLPGRLLRGPGMAVLQLSLKSSAGNTFSC